VKITTNLPTIIINYIVKFSFSIKLAASVALAALKPDILHVVEKTYDGPITTLFYSK